MRLHRCQVIVRGLAPHRVPGLLAVAEHGPRRLLQRQCVGSPAFWRAPPWASAAAGQRSVSRMMRAPAGFPSLRSSVRLEREVDDEAGGRHRGVSCSAITTRPWRWQLSVLVTRRHGHQVDLLQFQFSMRTVLASFPDFPFSYALSMLFWIGNSIGS